MLESPHEIVLGTSAADPLIEQFKRFGFDLAERNELTAEAAAALYGLESESSECVLTAGGQARGRVRLVETPHGPTTGSDYDARPIAIDLYTRDIDRSLAIAREIGIECRDLVEYNVGALEVREAESIWHDGLVVVFLEVSTRRPSLLDSDTDRMHSEVHSVVWSVPSIENALGFWRDEAQLPVLIDSEIRGPIISQLLGLSKPEVPVRFTLFCDDETRPTRVELLEFLEEEGEPRATWPLRQGQHIAVFEVTDIDAAIAAMPSASFGQPTSIGEVARAVAAETPGGPRIELRSRK